MDRKIIEKAVKYAIKKIGEIAERGPYEKFPHERQIQCFLYDYFKNRKKFFVHPEAGYPKDNRKKCDLRVIQDREEYWIEIKVASYGGKGYNNKPEKWKDDIIKLNKLTEKGTKKFFILIGLFLSNKFPKEKSNFRKFIEENSLIEIDKRKTFAWQKIEIVPQVWIWQ